MAAREEHAFHLIQAAPAQNLRRPAEYQARRAPMSVVRTRIHPLSGSTHVRTRPSAAMNASANGVRQPRVHSVSESSISKYSLPPVAWW